MVVFCGGGVLVVVLFVVMWCFCGGVCVVVFLSGCFYGVVVFLWCFLW